MSSDGAAAADDGDAATAEVLTEAPARAPAAWGGEAKVSPQEEDADSSSIDRSAVGAAAPAESGAATAMSEPDKPSSAAAAKAVATPAHFSRAGQKRTVLEWEDIKFSVRERGKYKDILNGVSGASVAGEMVALMGCVRANVRACVPSPILLGIPVLPLPHMPVCVRACMVGICCR